MFLEAAGGVARAGYAKLYGPRTYGDSWLLGYGRVRWVAECSNDRNRRTKTAKISSGRVEPLPKKASASDRGEADRLISCHVSFFTFLF